MKLIPSFQIRKSYFTPCSQGKYFLSLLIFAFLSFPVFAQSPSAMNKLAVQFDTLAKTNASELVYIQTSKDIYETGEDLWFKAYILKAQFFVPSPLSQTLYFQVLNEKTGTAIWQEKYEIQNGFAPGHVFLHDTLPEGDYLLEAFTGQSFFNDSTEFKAVRKIRVKKDMEAHPSLATDFDKLYYQPGDTVKATIKALSEAGEPLYAEIEAALLRETKELSHSQAVTNREGEATLLFVLQGPGEGLRVEANVKYEDKIELLNFSVPCKPGPPFQFNTFPEGGNLVAGIPSKIAFKAVNIEGEPIEIAGTLFENNNPLIEFKSIHAGMGSFEFTPDADKKYHIRLSQPVTDSTFLIPKIYREGISMQLIGRDKESLDFVVSQNPAMAEKMVYLRGQMRGTIYCMAAGKLRGKLKVKIPLKEFLQQGIAEFTLFDENLQPVAERLVYAHPGRNLYIKTELDKEKYETREKVTLKIKTTDENGLPVIANLGISVFDKLYKNPVELKNILTHCYLSSQLRGKIYDLAYYFNEKNVDRDNALDLLLLNKAGENIYGEKKIWRSVAK